MDADLKQAHRFNPIVSGGLSRYKSAPSSYFSNFVMEYRDVSDFLRPPPPKPLSPQIDTIFAQLASDQAAPVMKLEIQSDHKSPAVMGSSSSSYTPSSALPPPHPGAMMKSSVPAQVRIPVVKKQSSGSNNLARHNSLPSGLFSQIDVHNVAAAYFGGGSHQPDSSSAYSGIGNDDMKQSIINSDDAVLVDDDYMLNGFWNDSSSSEKLLTGVKRERAEDEFLTDGEDVKPFSGDSINQQFPQPGEMKKSGLLSHHLSLPKSSMEILSAMEKFLELQDSTVPVGVRAKRGCATHPRSIAERVSNYR